MGERSQLIRRPKVLSWLSLAYLTAEGAIAITFFLLAPYIAQDAIRTLVNGQRPTTSWLGIGLSRSPA